jgi:hypothetical protein
MLRVKALFLKADFRHNARCTLVLGLDFVSVEQDKWLLKFVAVLLNDDA